MKDCFKVKPFENFLAQYETNCVRDYATDMLVANDDINWVIPASTSGKYHNSQQLGDGGQLRHVLLVCSICNHLLSLKSIKDKADFDTRFKRDLIRTACLLHDCKKTNGGNKTVHEHPILGASFVLDTEVEHDVDLDTKKYIASLIETHSGQWRASKYSEVVLPEIKNDAQLFVHVCDYLGSRTDIIKYFEDGETESIYECIANAKEGMKSESKE